MAMKENTKNVWSFLMNNDGTDLTAADVADALGLEKRQVDGIFTSALQRKGYGIREEAEIELDDHSHKKVKFLRLTDAGRALNPDADE